MKVLLLLPVLVWSFRVICFPNTYRPLDDEPETKPGKWKGSELLDRNGNKIKDL